MADPRLQWRQLSQAQPNVAGLMRGSADSLNNAADAAKGILADYDKGQKSAGDQELARLLASATNQEELDALVNSEEVRGLRLSESGVEMMNAAQGNRVDWSNTRSQIRDRDGRLGIAHSANARAGAAHNRAMRTADQQWSDDQAIRAAAADIQAAREFRAENGDVVGPIEVRDPQGNLIEERATPLMRAQQILLDAGVPSDRIDQVLSEPRTIGEQRSNALLADQEERDAQTLDEIFASADNELIDNPTINTQAELRAAILNDERFTATENRSRLANMQGVMSENPTYLAPNVDPAIMAPIDAAIESSLTAADRAIDANPQTALLASADRLRGDDESSTAQKLADTLGLDAGNSENPSSFLGFGEDGFDQADLERRVKSTANRNNVSEEVAAAAMALAFQNDPTGRNTLDNRFNNDEIDAAIKEITQQDERDYRERRGNQDIMRTQMDSLRSSAAMLQAQIQQYPEGSQTRQSLENQLRGVMQQLGQVESSLSTSQTN